MPERMCIIAREVKPEAELIRFVRSPEGQVVPDLKRKLPGRGCWVSLSHEKVAEAQKRRLFSKAFAADTKSDEDLADRVEKLLKAEAVAALSLTRKGGLAVSGFMKVEEALHKGHIRLLLHVKGASADGTQKLNRKAGPKTEICDLFGSDELDLAFGRENVVHAAAGEGGLTEKLLDSLRRWAQYSGLEMTGSGTKIEHERSD